MNRSLPLAVRSHLFRKSLVALPSELIGAAGALVATNELVPALLYLFAGDLVGDQIGHRVAHVSRALDEFTGKEIKEFQISKPWVNGLLLLLAPGTVALATWWAGLSPNQIVGSAGIAWSMAHFAYRYLAFSRERAGAPNA